MKSMLLTSITFCLLPSLLGCDHSVHLQPATASAETGNVQPDSPREDVVEDPTERFYFVADGVALEVRRQLRERLGAWILSAPGESILHVIRTPDHKLVATIKIPNAKGKSRLRDPDVAAALPAIKALLTDPGHVPDDFRGQLALDRLGSTFWGLRQSRLPARITLVGTPVYHDPKLPQWCFGTNKHPSDSSLTNPDSTLPFLRLNRKAIPAEVPVVWLLERNDWGNGKLREDAIVRFFRHAFARAIGGELVRLTPDVTAAFEQQIQSAYLPLEDLTDSLPPRMLILQETPPPPVPMTSNNVAPQPPPELEPLFRQVAADPTQSLVAINWTSPYAATDLDLWIRKGAEPSELNYRNTKTSFGQLIRDVRHVGATSNHDVLGQWEVAVLKDARPADLDCWLNAYDAEAGPIHVTLITIFQGKQHSQNFEFPVSHGDLARGHTMRDQHPAWKRLSIKGL